MYFFIILIINQLYHLIDSVRYIGDIGILVRMLDMDPIEFIELKNQLCTNKILQRILGYFICKQVAIESLRCVHKTSTDD